MLIKRKQQIVLIMFCFAKKPKLNLRICQDVAAIDNKTTAYELII